MSTKRIYLLIGIVFAVGLLSHGNVSADMGPKSSMDFKFVQDMPGGKVTVVSGILYVCEEQDCSDAQPVTEKGNYGGYGFLCNDQGCDAQYDGSYFHLEVTFSDGITRKSNIFGNSYLNARYKVTIKSDSLTVEELEGHDAWKELEKFLIGFIVVVAGMFFGPLLIGIPVMVVRRMQGKPNVKLGSCLVMIYMTLFALWGLAQDFGAFLFTFVVEFGIAFGYLWFRKIQMNRILFAIAAANAFTQPVFFFLVSRSSNMILATIIGELIVWFGEAAFVYIMQQNNCCSGISLCLCSS